MSKTEVCVCHDWTTKLRPVIQNHHPQCEKYHTEKFPYLFYYEEAENAWVPAPDSIEGIISVEDQLEMGEDMEIQFKRVDLTDEEFDKLPSD